MHLLKNTYLFSPQILLASLKQNSLKLHIYFSNVILIHFECSKAKNIELTH